MEKVNIKKLEFGNNPLENLTNLQIMSLEVVDKLATIYKSRIESGNCTSFDEAAYAAYSIYIRMQSIITLGFTLDDEKFLQLCSESLDFVLHNYAPDHVKRDCGIDSTIN